MGNTPENSWLNLYERKKALLAPSADLNAYFGAGEICGMKMDLLPMGTVHFPSGRILVCDPLVYLNREAKPYFHDVPVGVFPIDAAVVRIEDDHFRYAAVRVAFSDEWPVRFVEALMGHEDLENLDEGEFFGFNVDAGLGTVVDEVTRDAWCDFAEQWHGEHPDGNLYDDYFAEEFRKSREQHPKYQRKDGDWINWTIPGTDLSVPMFQSGFGDGAYPVYFGYDRKGKISQLVIHFINIALEFEEDEG